jgi:alginate O-acetyltransferase complex protein AlgI
MLFNSGAFLVFFPVVYATYLALPSQRLQNLLLLGASYVFYGWTAPRYVAILALYTLVTFLIGVAIEKAATKRTRKWMLYLGVGINLAVLGYFKYAGFLAAEVARAFTALGFQADEITLKVFLPIGVSFFTFQSIAYLVDVYRGQFPATRNLLVFAVFKAFFPQLVAGPIERAAHMMSQIEHPRVVSASDVAQGTFWILLGYFLKAVIADRVAPLADYNFSEISGPDRGGLAAANGVWAFTLQIYGDFAGYTYIALGIARLLGFRLQRNFLGPYLATNIQEFWRRWHVTLSSWLRDYLYIPLGGSKRAPFRTYLNLIATMALGGLWHGASWTFLLWGLYHGVALAAHNALKPAMANLPGTVRLFGGWIATMLIVMGGWTLFRVASFSELEALTRRLFDWTTGVTSEELGASLVLLLFSVTVLVVQWAEERKPSRTTFGPVMHPWQIGVLVMLFLSVLSVGFSEHRFIYFQF